ncbi:MAG: cytochrome b/b6 domain-containing protein [Sphingomonas bacterium]|nr:cytochrome b/b6 domain-containing protein [Sphingomonas bacterium]
MSTSDIPADIARDQGVGDLGPGDLVKRHRLSTRLWHWLNVVTLAVMLMSGLMIFNAHPRLYWGHYGANADPAWFEIGSTENTGFVQAGPLRVETTGVLGRWTDQNSKVQRRAFPYWITIPSRYSLADARLWHLAFAWVLGVSLLAYMAVSLVNRHFKRDLTISRAEIRPAHVWADIKDHARLRFPTGAAALRYNILQKLAYASVLFVMLPLIIFTGLAMSPAIDSGWSWLLDIFGGRQSARSLHFIATVALVGFFFVHIAMVVLAGPINELRSMISGYYRLPGKRPNPESEEPAP